MHALAAYAANGLIMPLAPFGKRNNTLPRSLTSITEVHTIRGVCPPSRLATVRPSHCTNASAVQPCRAVVVTAIPAVPGHCKGLQLNATQLRSTIQKRPRWTSPAHSQTAR